MLQDHDLLAHALAGGDDDEGERPLDWVLFTPSFDYVKEPYWVRAPGMDEPVLCYPNAGMLHEMGGKGRYFYACECEVKFAGWDEDPNHPATRRKRGESAPEELPITRSERQANAKARRKHQILQRGLPPGMWRAK